MTALLKVKKCGCRRSLCFKCGKPVGRLSWDLQCARHSEPYSLSGLWNNGTTVTICLKCARKPKEPAWPPPHANWKKAQPDAPGAR